MEKKQIDSNNDFDLPVIADIDLAEAIDQPRPEPIVTKKIEDKPKKSHKVLYIILSISGLLFIIAGILVWLFVFNGIYRFQGLPLSDFSNNLYSLKIPEGYMKSENNLGGSGTDITFVDPNEKVEGTQSKVYIVSGEMKVADKENYFKKLDNLYSESNIEKSKSDTGVNGSANIKYSKDNVKGMEARTVSYDITKLKDHVGRYNKISIFSKGAIYEIVISSPGNNPGLDVDASKIFNSFTLK